MSQHGTYELTKTDVDRLHGLVKGHWECDQIRLIAQQVAPQATMPELAHFLHVSKARGLDPFAKQVYAIHRNAKVPGGGYEKRMTIQVSIDGYRLIADRSGEYCGNDDPVFEEKDGKPIKASVTVWRLIQGERRAFTASARMSEYRHDKGPMWGRMPFLMLSKCAEALALRKAFPEALSGIYTDAEMDQADTPREVVNVASTSRPAAPSEFKADAKDDARAEVERLIGEGPGLDIADAVREELDSGKPAAKVLQSVRHYLGVGAGQKVENAAQAPSQEQQRRATQAPSDGF